MANDAAGQGGEIKAGSDTGGVMRYSIRQMKTSEYPLLAEFLYEAIFVREGEEPAPRNIIEKPELQVYIKDFGSDKDDHCFLAQADGQVVGAVWARNVKGSGNIDNTTPEFAISLYKEYRRCGIGTALMGRMLEHLREAGYERISLAVQKDNYALKMYQAAGFYVVGENEEEYIMVKELRTDYEADIREILSHRHDNGADLWTTPDKKLLKGAPFTTLESVLYLRELGVPADDPVLEDAASLIFSTWKEDGRFKISPSGGIYPCQTALAAVALCHMGYAADPRMQKTFRHFLDTQQPDGGWKCNKYSFGRGPETEHSTPYTTLEILDAFRFTDRKEAGPALDQAVEFLLKHWRIRKPISPCHYGIGTLFMQIEYPFRGYGLFHYVYVLSFYESARKDDRFKEALEVLESKLADGQIVVERVVPKLAKLSFCKKNKPSKLATYRYQEILKNLE